MGGGFEGEWIYVYVWLSPFVVHLKLLQHCWSAVSQYKIKSWKKSLSNYLQFLEQGLTSLAFMPQLGSQVGHLWSPQSILGNIWRHPDCRGSGGCYWQVDSTVSATKKNSAPNSKGSRIMKPYPASIPSLVWQKSLIIHSIHSLFSFSLNHQTSQV